ncbi:hypothetical protein ABW21_db0208366 [Orbilia brochopaga]|nr:hypothetical protein ABW21_db0208366 [Drechslerella brochopaga]
MCIQAAWRQSVLTSPSGWGQHWYIYKTMVNCQRYRVTISNRTQPAPASCSLHLPAWPTIFRTHIYVCDVPGASFQACFNFEGMVDSMQHYCDLNILSLLIVQVKLNLEKQA